MTLSRGHPSSPSKRRVCHSCNTDVTSQWRYGTNNVLLCNACGIRWKRQNRSSQAGRVKPGPKCVRPAGADGKLIAPCNDSPYSRLNTGSRAGSMNTTNTSNGHRPKKDLGTLVDPSLSDPVRRGQKHHTGRSQNQVGQHSESPTGHASGRPLSGHGHLHRKCTSIAPKVSPIAISNLINIPDEAD